VSAFPLWRGLGGGYKKIIRKLRAGYKKVIRKLRAGYKKVIKVGWGDVYLQSGMLKKIC